MSSSTLPLLPLPISTNLPPNLTFLSNPISYYLNADPPYNNVKMGALVFTPPFLTPQLLLLQRGTYLGLRYPSSVPELDSKTFSSSQESYPYYQDPSEDSNCLNKENILTPRS